MSKEFGNAGQGARDMAFKREMIVLGCLVAVFFLGWLWMQNMANISALGLPTVIVLIVAFKLVLSGLDKKSAQVKKRAKQAARGAVGEVKVAAKMAELPEGFISFHDLAFDGFNIDHVAVSEAGIFLIETKSHRGKITADRGKLLLNGNPPDKDFINQTWRQTYQLQTYLEEKIGKKFAIKPILCFTSAFVQLRQPIKGVEVVNAKSLNDLLNRQTGKVTVEDIGVIAGTLRMKLQYR